MQKLLIVGCGDVARRTLPRLLGHYRVFALLRDPAQFADWRARGARPLLADLDRAQSLQRISGLADVVLHFAPPPDNGTQDNRTRHLLAALAQLPQPPARVLLASSANVYGNQTGGMLDESTPPQPANDYAVSKLAMEHMARLWMARLPITIVRPFNYTGVGQSADFLLPKIVAHFRRRAASIELGNLDVWRDFSDVRAVADAYCRLLDAPAAVGATVNVCSGQSHSLREVIAMAEQITGHALAVQVNPAFVRANEVKTLLGNPARLHTLIGADWANPLLQDTLRWMLENPAP